MRGRSYALKSRPGDFVVEELLGIEPGESGRFGIYRLRKTGLDTHSALRIVSTRKNLPFRAIGCAGMKDRHGTSVQYISIDRKWGEGLDFTDRSVSLEHVGWSDRELRPGSHRGNRFEVTLRRMDRRTLGELTRNAGTAAGLPLPNYYDSQRFGSLRGAGPPPGAEGVPAFGIVRVLGGDLEAGLKGFLTGTYRKERSRIKAYRRELLERWGDWELCARISDEARHEDHRRIFELLRDGGDLEAALRLMRDTALRMQALALQGWLWNERLKRELTRRLGREALVPVRYEAGELLFPRLSGMALKEYERFALESRDGGLDLPRAGMGEAAEPYRRSLELLGLEMEDLGRLAELGVSLPRGARPPFVPAEGLRLLESGEDAPGARRRFWAKLSFTLRPGSYATVVVKALLGE